MSLAAYPTNIFTLDFSLTHPAEYVLDSMLIFSSQNQPPHLARGHSLRRSDGSYEFLLAEGPPNPAPLIGTLEPGDYTLTVMGALIFEELDEGDWDIGNASFDASFTLTVPAPSVICTLLSGVLFAPMRRRL